MRIAFLTHEPFDPPSGGGSSQLPYLARELARRGHAVHVFAPQPGGVRECEERFGIRIHPFRAWAMGRYTFLRNAKYLAYPFFLERLVRRTARTERLRFDLIVAQHAVSAIAAGRLGRELGVPTAMNFMDHLSGFFDVWPRHLAPPFPLAWLKRFELYLPARYGAAAVFAISDELADAFRATGFPADRIVPLYYGYDDRLFQPGDRPPPSAPPLVVMHGSLDRHQLTPFCTEALLRLHAARPDTRFRFVGHRTEALRTVLEAVRGRIPAAAIETTGFVPYGEVAARIRDATVGIAPYPLGDGTHRALLSKTIEYAALGIPVACTPLRGTMRYWKGEPLVRFSGETPESFADTVLSWFGETAENRAAWGRAARERVRAELDWGPFCRRFADCLETLAQPGGAGSPRRPGADRA